MTGKKVKQVKKGDIPKWIATVAKEDAKAPGGRKSGPGWSGKKGGKK